MQWRGSRYFIEHGIGFALYEAFTIDEEDRIVFESDTASDVEDGKK